MINQQILVKKLKLNNLQSLIMINFV